VSINDLIINFFEQTIAVIHFQQLNFLALEMTVNCPKITAAGSFNIGFNLIPMVNMNKKARKYLLEFNQSFDFQLIGTTVTYLLVHHQFRQSENSNI